MIQEYIDRINWAKSNRKQWSRVIAKTAGKRLDQEFRAAHEEAFSCTDCLECANCCKTTGPLFTPQDIKRVSRRLKMSETAFIQAYLRTDSEGDQVLQSVPCPFLEDDNKCMVYEDRPRACRSFPHTDESGQAGIFHLTKKNATICPAVARMVKRISNSGK